MVLGTKKKNLLNHLQRAGFFESVLSLSPWLCTQHCLLQAKRSWVQKPQTQSILAVSLVHNRLQYRLSDTFFTDEVNSPPLSQLDRKHPMVLFQQSFLVHIYLTANTDEARFTIIPRYMKSFCFHAIQEKEQNEKYQSTEYSFSAL